MTVHHADQSVTVHHGDALDVLRGLPDASVDAVVTDPPYGLEFMGKEWDRFDQSPRRVAGTGGSQSPFAHHAVALTPTRNAAFGAWCEQWAAECLRILRPGGHLLAFGGTRTWHRLTCAIEDAGLEVRDSIAWLYGSGFPKSLDVSKAIDKLDAADERLARAREFQAWLRQHLTPQQVNAATGTDMGHHLTTHPTQPFVATAGIFDQLRPLLPEVPARIEELVRQRTVESQNFAARRVIGTTVQPDATRVRLGFVGENYNGDAAGATRKVPTTEAHTPAAQQWQGWGTALKPSHEPIVVARKPLAGTVAANILAHGTGALNIAACRVTYQSDSDKASARPQGAATSRPGALAGKSQTWTTESATEQTAPSTTAETTATSASPSTGSAPSATGTARTGFTPNQSAGRWPANVVLTHTEHCQQTGTTTERVGGGANASGGFVDGYQRGDSWTGTEVTSPVWRCADGCPVGELDRQSGTSQSRTGGTAPKRSGGIMGRHVDEQRPRHGHDDEGGASRFFPTFKYQAKAPTRERVKVDGIAHPTVKPLALMQWLVRLVTPPGGVVLDPFAGSGTTVEAALLEGVRCIAVEREADYLPLIAARIARATQQPPAAKPKRRKADLPPSLFDDDEIGA